jgi:outer membrane protein TolC
VTSTLTLPGRNPSQALLILALLAAATPARAQTPPATVLTLSQAVTEALKRNDRIVNHGDVMELSDLAVRQARNAFHPKVVPNIQGSFGQTNVDNQTYRLDVTQRFTTGTEFRVGVGASTAQIPGMAGDGEDIRFYNADTTLILSQPLLRGFGPGVTRRTLTGAEARQQDAARQRVLVEQQVAVDVAAAYYRLVAQQALVAVAAKSLERARSLLAVADAKREAGLVSQLDVLRARNLVSQTELQVFDAQGAIEDARDYLTFLIGRPPGDPFDVAGSIPKQVDPLSAEDAVLLALESRLDLAIAVSSARDADRAVTYTRNQLLPQLDVSLALTRRQTAPTFLDSFGVDHFQTATFFTVSMPVDRTPQQIEHQNALLDRARRQRDLETLRRRIGDDVRRAVRNRDRVLRTLETAEASIAIGQQEVEVAQLRSERGLSDNLDVITAETNLLAMEGRRLSALAELAIARLSLRAAVGILDSHRDIIDVDGGAVADRRLTRGGDGGGLATPGGGR